MVSAPVRDPVAVGRMLAQGREAEALLLQAHDQRLEHRRRPRVLARPDAQVGHQDVAAADVAQRLLQQRLVAGRFAGQLVAQEAGRRPAHVLVAAGFGGRQERGRGLAARRAKQRQRLLARDLLQALRRLVDLLAVLRRRPGELAALVGRRPMARTRKRGGVARHVAAPVDVVPGVRGEFVAFGRARLPPGRPVVAQAAVAGLACARWRAKKVTFTCCRAQHLGDQRRHVHVARCRR